MKISAKFTLALLTCAVLASCGGKQSTTPVEPQEPSEPTPVKPKPEVLLPGIPDKPFVEVNGLTLEANTEKGTDQLRWIDFQTGKVFKTSDESAPSACAVIDAGLFYDYEGLRFASPAGTEAAVISLAADNPSSWKSKLRTRFFTLSPAEMNAEKFAAIKDRSSLNAIELSLGNIQNVLGNSTLSPFQSDCIKGTPMYIGFKTYTVEENNNYGIIEVKSVSLEKGKLGLVINYKMGTSAPAAKYTNVEKVIINNGKFYVDGKEFYVNGAAATMEHAMIAEYGGNLVRVYSLNLASAGDFLDRMYEAGLKVHVGLPTAQYKSNSKIFEDETEKAAQIDKICEIVEAFKTHPAVLCWSIGNELEVDGYSDKTGIYKYVGEASKRIHEIDSDHPVTYCATGTVSATKMGYLTQYCSDLDFLSINIYHATLANSDVNIKKYGWTKPFFIGEYGPIGTWQKTSLNPLGRINTWGSLIQLTSDEAARDYEECYELIKNFDNCLGSTAFWWGYQTHGEVLGWYPFFTKDGYKMAILEALRNCWTGESKTYTFPQIASWEYSMKLNGKTVHDAHNPKVSGGTSCTASVDAKSRNGNPLKYKWFIYRDNTYDVSNGVTSSKITRAAEALSDGSMNEDANADLFKDRTKADVEFVAPATPGNYRLYVIAYDEKTRSAATGCLNFQVID